MAKQGVNKFGSIAVGSLLVLALALASTPARAHHGHSIVGPAIAFIALGALFHHGHHNHHRHHYRHYDRSHRRHNHSRGGYHSPRRNHYKR